MLQTGTSGRRRISGRWCCSRACSCRGKLKGRCPAMVPCRPPARHSIPRSRSSHISAASKSQPPLLRSGLWLRREQRPLYLTTVQQASVSRLSGRATPVPSRETSRSWEQTESCHRAPVQTGCLLVPALMTAALAMQLRLGVRLAQRNPASRLNAARCPQSGSRTRVPLGLARAPSLSEGMAGGPRAHSLPTPNPQNHAPSAILPGTC